jgi:L-lactate dehydrogenase (cytochrome)
MNPSNSKLSRKLRQCLNIDELRMLAKKSLPLPIFDHIDGGSDDEVTLADNVSVFSKYYLTPRYCSGVDKIDTSTTVMGTKLDWPLMMAPWGGQALINRTGECGVARAAQNNDMVFCLSSFSSTPLEEVAEATSAAKIFQLQPARSKELMSDLIVRAKAAGYTALILTIDNPAHGNRERDIRNGFGVPPKFSLRSWLSVVLHPSWALSMLGFSLRFANYDEHMMQPSRDIEWLGGQLVNTLSWEDVSGLVKEWDGPFAVKGIVSKHDARKAVDAGATAVIVSNQGARHFDYAPSTLSALKEVVDEVGEEAEVIFDGGIRRGTDIIKALALGAKACMTARPFAYGMAAGGEAGVNRAADILRSEFEKNMIFIGASSLDDVTEDLIRDRNV